MKCRLFFAILLLIGLQLLIIAAPAPGGYRFLRARCQPYYGEGLGKIDGPLNLCTFPSKYDGITQEDIDAVLEHAQSLDISDLLRSAQ